MRAGCALLLLAGLALRAGAAELAPEYQVKAAFLYNFTKFVEWPPQHFTAGDRPIVIGVLGPNRFGAELERIVRARKVNGRALVIRILETTAAVSATDVLFVPAGEEGQLDREILATLRSAGVLTVGESPQFGQLGGMITFVIEADKVRFEINQAAAGRAGLKLSAQLLKLATVVRQEP